MITMEMHCTGICLSVHSCVTEIIHAVVLIKIVIEIQEIIQMHN